MATHRQRFIVHLVRGAVLSAALMGCGGQPGTVDAGTGSTETDVTPPRLVAKYPENGQQSVAVSSEIVMTFSEPLNVRRMALVASAVRLFQVINGDISPIVDKVVRWDAQSNTLYVHPPLVINPAGQRTFFDPNRHYTVEITNGLTDVAGNQLDAGDDGVVTWRFTTSEVFDDQAPAWNEAVTVRAIADRFDRIAVCWWSGTPPEQVNACDQSVETLPPAAVDLPSGEPGGVLYTVEYRRRSEATFTPQRSGLGSHRVTLTDLIASTDYEIQLRAKDTAGNQSDVVVAAAAVATPKAGRLYAANHTGNGVSMFTDVAQAVDNKPATVVTADQTRLGAPTGVAVDTMLGDPSRLDPEGYVYVAEPQRNRIAAYKLKNNADQVELGTYGVSQNPVPDWTIEGSLTAADVTELCGPSTLYLERRANGEKILYVANALALPVSYSSQPCRPDNIVVFNVTTPPQGTNQAPIETIERPSRFLTPIGFAVDNVKRLMYVANRDDPYFTEEQGWAIDVYAFTGTLSNASLDAAPRRRFWGTRDGSCVVAEDEPVDRICGPTALAYDAVTDKLYVANRRKHNILVFSNASTVTGSQTPTVLAGINTGLTSARPVGMFLDRVTRRLYVTTDTNQSVLVFDADAAATGGNVLPLRVIRGTKTMLGQPANDLTLQSRGPFAVTVARNAADVDEAYVVTPGLFGDGTGLTPVPSLAMFNVSVGSDPPANTSTLSDRTTNTVPDRVVVNPLLGASAVALDAVRQRLYVASFYANTIAVYNDPLAFSSGQRSPDRIIAGPATRLDHPIALLFRRLDPTHPGSLYVVNQSSHSVAVFEEGDDTEARPLLSRNVAPARYIGPPEGTIPFDANANLTEMVYPTGLAIDPDHGILYVSNRDATSFQDFAGRKIVAFSNATTIGTYDPTVGIVATNNIAPTWKIEGVAGSTDQTRLRRPAGLLLLPADSVSDDWLVVSNRGGGTILIFKGIGALVQAAIVGPRPSYNQPPALVIGSPLLVAPIGLAFDATQRDLYVSDSSRILAITLPADTAPSLTPRVIQGAATGLSGTIGLALDPLN